MCVLKSGSAWGCTTAYKCPTGDDHDSSHPLISSGLLAFPQVIPPRSPESLHRRENQVTDPCILLCSPLAVCDLWGRITLLRRHPVSWTFRAFAIRGRALNASVGSHTDTPASHREEGSRGSSVSRTP